VIEKQIVVRASQEHAFQSWHNNVHLWWPKGHHPSGDPAGRMVLEAQEGGRFFEAAPDGREIELGRVQRFEPSTLLVYTFFMGTGAATPTLVEVRFVPVPEGTQVRVTHRAHDAGDRFSKVVPVFHRSWERVLSDFSAHMEAP
jgi:uncharacterized protein YndB with AHSA1/START domain